MNAIAAILVRLTMMVFGFSAACLGASAFLHLVWIGPLAGAPGISDLVDGGSLLLTVAAMAAVVGYTVFVPALVVIAIAELTSRRGWLFHAVAGAAVALTVIGLFWSGMPVEETDIGFASLTIVGAGMVGGLSYWLVAGRHAGGWRDGDPQPRRE